MAAVENGVVELTVQPLYIENKTLVRRIKVNKKKNNRWKYLNASKKIELARVYAWHTYWGHVAYTSTE